MKQIYQECRILCQETTYLSKSEVRNCCLKTPERMLLLPVTKLCPTLCEPIDCRMPGFLVLHYLPEFAQLLSFEYMMPSNHLILCSPLLLLPSIFSSIRVFSNESALCIRWSKYWSFSISSSHEYSGLISFRMNWLDLLAVQGTLKSLLQKHHFFGAPLSL